MQTDAHGFEFAADVETPVSAYLKLAPLKPVFLLESVERNETIGRFSFLGILPERYFSLNPGESHEPFFAAMQDCLVTMPSHADSRFASGLVGFLSYHIASLMHPRLKSKRSEFPVAGFVLPSAVLVFDHLKRRIRLVTILPAAEEMSLAREVGTLLSTALRMPGPGRSGDPAGNLSRDEYCDRVRCAQESIRAGEIYQVVLSILFSGETEASPFQMYRALRMINPSPYMFYLDFQDRFQFLGSSPETMVRTEGDRLVLKPIAGTRPRGATVEKDRSLESELRQDEKEKAEHLMLLDLARNDAGRICEPGSVKVTEFMKVDRYSHVMHLVSTLEGRLQQKPQLQDLFSAVFPAGTVTGAPKLRAMQVIDELEPHSRELYAGSVGYFGSNGETDHCISIRCLLHQDHRYFYTAGAGITADSVPEREYEEVINKAMAQRQVLKMVEKPL